MSCLTKAEEPSLPYYLPIAGRRVIGFIPFPRVSVLCEMQSVSSRIWTCVAVSISCDDNHYTTGTSFFFYYCYNFLWNVNCLGTHRKLLFSLAIVVKLQHLHMAVKWLFEFEKVKSWYTMIVDYSLIRNIKRKGNC